MEDLDTTKLKQTRSTALDPGNVQDSHTHLLSATNY